jgi:hypothetical protein
LGIHHGVTVITIIAALRDHSLEWVLRHGLVAIPTGMLGITPVHYAGTQLAIRALGRNYHSNLTSDWGVLRCWAC